MCDDDEDVPRSGVLDLEAGHDDVIDL